MIVSSRQAHPHLRSVGVTKETYPFTPAELAGIKGRSVGELYEVEHVLLNILKEQVKLQHERVKLLRVLYQYTQMES